MSAFEGVDVHTRRRSSVSAAHAPAAVPRRRSTLSGVNEPLRRQPSWAPSAAQEESWLAIDAEVQASARAENELRKSATPLPWRVLSVVVVMRLAEPISFSVVFPFVNRMVLEIGAAKTPADVGFYGGMIESLFALTQLLTVLPWASLSDSWGRKPVMLLGLSGVFVSQILFGTSTSLWQLVFARCLAGALNGNVAVVKSLVSDITDPSNRAKAFTLLPVTWALGCSLGSLIGGYLAHPEEQFPRLFGKDGFFSFNGLWIVYPYLLPCVVAASCVLSGILLGIFLLEETLPSIVIAAEAEAVAQATQTAAQRSEQQPLLAERNSSYQAIDHSQDVISQTPPPAETSVLQMLTIPHIQNVLVSYGLLALCAVSLDAVYVLWFFTPISDGGLALSSSQTGRVLATFGVVAVIFQSYVFTELQSRLGTLRLYRISLACWPLTAAVLPFATMIAQRALPPGIDETNKTMNDLLPPGARAMVWAVIITSNFFRVAASMSFSANNLLVNQSVVFLSGEKLGTLNGLAQASSSFTRALGPYGSTCLFAWSIEMGFSYMIWPIFVVLGTLAVASTLQMADLEAEDVLESIRIQQEEDASTSGSGATEQ